VSHARGDSPPVAAHAAHGQPVEHVIQTKAHSSPRRAWAGLARAIAFLTIVPVGAAAGDGLSDAAGWFPLVGAAVGALAGGVRVLCGGLVGATVATVLAMIALVIVTGALHQDGLADTADGLGARNPLGPRQPGSATGAAGAAATRARRLDVMRDSSTGVFGALALIIWALLLLTSLAALDGDRALRALVVACALGRWAALVHAAATPAARADGLGAALHVGRLAVGTATVVSAIGALAIAGLAPGAAAIGAGALVAGLSVLFARRTLGGRTGDTLGATVAITEVAVCTALLAVWQG
jgi:adenosylcobinamide-GDP ribazoletransferase